MKHRQQSVGVMERVRKGSTAAKRKTIRRRAVQRHAARGDRHTVEQINEPL